MFYPLMVLRFDPVKKMNQMLYTETYISTPEMEIVTATADINHIQNRPMHYKSKHGE